MDIGVCKRVNTTVCQLADWNSKIVFFFVSFSYHLLYTTIVINIRNGSTKVSSSMHWVACSLHLVFLFHLLYVVQMHQPRLKSMWPNVFNQNIINLLLFCFFFLAALINLEWKIDNFAFHYLSFFRGKNKDERVKEDGTEGEEQFESTN